MHDIHVRLAVVSIYEQRLDWKYSTQLQIIMLILNGYRNIIYICENDLPACDFTVSADIHCGIDSLPYFIFLRTSSRSHWSSLWIQITCGTFFVFIKKQRNIFNCIINDCWNHTPVSLSKLTANERMGALDFVLSISGFNEASSLAPSVTTISLLSQWPACKG